MVVVGISSAITSTHALWSGAPLNCRYTEFGASIRPTRKFDAVRQQRQHARAQSYNYCRGCKRTAASSTLEMFQGVGNLSLASPSPYRALPVSFGISDSRVVPRELGPSQCGVRGNREHTGRIDLSALLQQRWECQCQCQSQVVGKSGSGRRISALAQYSSGTKASSVSQEEACADAIDPGLLARVAKVYRPAVILPGLGNNSDDCDVLVQSLEALEVACTVVKVARIDWLRSAAGLLDGDYWRGKRRPRPVLNWNKEQNLGSGLMRGRCSQDEADAKTVSTVGKPVQCLAVASMAAAVLLTSTSPATAEDLYPNAGSMCNVAALPELSGVLKLDAGENAFEEDESTMPLVMGGMSMQNFNPARYSGQWFEVASLKLGFSGQGQEDCHCTQGVYTFDEPNRAIKVDTFCVHGSPTGYITGIRGKVQCVTDQELSKLQSDFERQQMIQQKCFLRFPSLPFIPKQPYNVLNTDYDNFALVSGSRDTSFVQIYSRTPNPGPEFIEKYKNELKDKGYNPDLIKDTPQDCEYTSLPQLEAMMSGPGMEEAMTNVFPTLELSRSFQLDPFTNTFQTLKKLIVETFFKR